MDLFNAILRGSIGGVCSMFGNVHPLVSMTPLAILTGIGMLWLFQRTSDQRAILETKKRLQAYLLELRLFGDDLSLVWQSQKNLLRGNLRYIRLMLRPAVFAIVPLLFLLIHLDAFYGLAPLPLGRASVITVQSNAAVAGVTQAPRLEAPPEIAIETPAARSLESSQFSWRVRPLHEVDGHLRFIWNGQEWDKSIAAGRRLRYLSGRRVRSWTDAFWYPGEDRLPLEQIEWVEIRYPPANIELAGIELHWLIWFFVISMASAFLLRGYFKVVF